MAAYFKLKVFFGSRVVTIFLHPELAEKSGRFNAGNTEVDWTPEWKPRKEGHIDVILDKWERLRFPADSQCLRALRELDD